MTTDPTYALQVAIISTVRASVAVADVMRGAATIYDPVPSQPIWPYVAIAEINSKPAGAEGYDASDAQVVLHVWTNSDGSGEAKRIIAALTKVLNTAIVIEGFRVVIHEPLGSASGTPVEDGPNGILTMRYKVQAIA